MSAGDDTTTAAPLDGLSAGEHGRLIVSAILRTIVTLALVVAIYFLIPMDRGTDAGTVTGRVLGMLAFVAVIGWQLRQIVRSGHPSIVPSRPWRTRSRSTSSFLRRRTSSWHMRVRHRLAVH